MLGTGRRVEMRIRSRLRVPQAEPPNTKSPIEGTWELVSFRYGAQSGTMPKDRREIKLISGSHFVWVVYDLRKKKPTSVGGGTCALLSGNRC